MLLAIRLTHPDARRAATPAHEQQASISRERGLAFILGATEKARRRTRRTRGVHRHLPDVEVAVAFRRKDDRLPVRRPGWLTIPFRTRRNAGPFRVARDHPEIAAHAQGETAVGRITRVAGAGDLR